MPIKEVLIIFFAFKNKSSPAEIKPKLFRSLFANNTEFCLATILAKELLIIVLAVILILFADISPKLSILSLAEILRLLAKIIELSKFFC